MFFFFNAAAPTGISTLSLHDALPILDREHSIGPTTALTFSRDGRWLLARRNKGAAALWDLRQPIRQDRKSTRLNSSHSQISYAVFCLKKKIISSHTYTTSLAHHTSFI